MIIFSRSLRIGRLMILGCQAMFIHRGVGISQDEVQGTFWKIEMFWTLIWTQFVQMYTTVMTIQPSNFSYYTSSTDCLVRLSNLTPLEKSQFATKSTGVVKIKGNMGTNFHAEHYSIFHENAEFSNSFKEMEIKIS